MKKYLFLFIFFGYAICINAQPLFNTQINFVSTEYLFPESAFLKLMDGNYLFMHWRTENPPILFNISNHSLEKFNTQGELMWEVTHDHNEAIPDLYLLKGLLPIGMKQLSNEKIVVVGAVRPSKGAYMYVIDNNGDSLLYKTFPEYTGFGNISIKENGLFTVTSKDTSDTADGNLILEIDSSTGQVVNSYPLEYSDYHFPDYEDHYFRYNYSYDTIRLEKISYSDELLSENLIIAPEGFNYSNFFWSDPVFNFTQDEGLVMYDNGLVSVDENLVPIHSFPFNDNSLSHNPQLEEHDNTYVLPTTDGGYLLSGTLPAVSVDMVAFFMKINSDGEEEWSRSFVPFYAEAAYIKYIIEESDGYVFIRHRNNGQIWITKITKQGQLVFTTEPTDFEKTLAYPNPCNDFLHVNIPDEYLQSNLSVYDIVGKKVLEERLINDTTIRLKTENLNSGIYILKIDKGNELPVLVSKFCKK